MTREEAIIEAGIEYSIQNSPYCIGGDNFYEKARELNRNKSFEAGVIWADKNPKSPWISVDEDLPCYHEELKPNSYATYKVIVLLNDGRIRETYMFYDKWWEYRKKITHWMLIPELPKERR